MSEWDEGYAKGYEDGKTMAGIDEVFNNNEDAHWVPVKPHGSEGATPTEEAKYLCQSYFENGETGSSCVSGGGGSVCGGFMGQHKNCVLCLFEYPAKNRKLFLEKAKNA